MLTVNVIHWWAETRNYSLHEFHNINRHPGHIWDTKQQITNLQTHHYELPYRRETRRNTNSKSKRLLPII